MTSPLGRHVVAKVEARMTGPLVVFDLNGMLCDTVGVDAECFVQACAEWLRDGARQVDWAAARSASGLPPPGASRVARGEAGPTVGPFDDRWGA